MFDLPKSMSKLARLLFLIVPLFLLLLNIDFALNALKNHGYLSERLYQLLLYPVLTMFLGILFTILGNALYFCTKLIKK